MLAVWIVGGFGLNPAWLFGFGILCVAICLSIRCPQCGKPVCKKCLRLGKAGPVWKYWAPVYEAKCSRCGADIEDSTKHKRETN